MLEETNICHTSIKGLIRCSRHGTFSVARGLKKMKSNEPGRQHYEGGIPTSNRNKSKAVI